MVFDSITAAKARGADVVICDTAGRLHNKKNLMDELKKITRICRQQAEGCSIETLLVLDATTGQNAVNQAKLFSETADITGIVLTKLDGTAKGGIIISIHKELGIPVKLVGVGEKLDDLMDFSAHDYAEALFVSETEFTGNYERLTDGGNDENEEDISEEISENTEDMTEEISEADDVDTDMSDDEEESISEEIMPEEEMSEEADSAEEESDDESDSEENEEEAESAEESDEDKSAEKKDRTQGRFGFLFKEITFGKKKKKDEE